MIKADWVMGAYETQDEALEETLKGSRIGNIPDAPGRQSYHPYYISPSSHWMEPRAFTFSSNVRLRELRTNIGIKPIG